MAYTTLAQLKKRLGSVVLAQLAVDDNTTDVSTTALADTALGSDATAIANIDEAISDADLLINQYVQGVVDITSSTVQAQLEPCSAALAVFYLYQRRHNNGEDNPRYFDYQEKVRWLKMIAKREIRLATDPEVPTDIAYSTTTNTTPVFNDTSLDPY